MSQAAPRIQTAAEVDPDKLDRFLRGYFSPAKCDFLRCHSAWRHRGQENRLVALMGDEIAGYCAAIPTETVVGNRLVPTLWRTDLYVAPPFRGLGLQRLLDRRLAAMALLNLAIPNRTSMAISRHHSWGVRGDFSLLLLPLVPTQLLQVRAAEGIRGRLLRGAARLADLGAWPLRCLVARYEPRLAREISEPSPDLLAAIFQRRSRGWLTTNKSPDFIRWRYMDSPHREQYRYVIAGLESAPTVAAISRTFRRQGVVTTRVLDILGDLADREALADALRLLAREAVRGGAVQVTAKATNRPVAVALRAAGFFWSQASHFCWLSTDPELVYLLGRDRGHWTLADSDSDTFN